MNNQSDQINELAKALAAAQGTIDSAKIDADNPFFNSRYATLGSVWYAAGQVLAPNGLSITQTFEPSDGRVMHITTTLLHISGQWIRGTLSIAPQQATPQGIGSAVTYGRRYALAAMLGIVAEEDDDGNAASHQQAPQRQPERRPATPHANAPAAAPAASKPVTPTPAPKSAEKPLPVAANVPAGAKPVLPAGDWRSVKVHFGKKAGVELGGMEERSLLWYIQTWQPKDKPGYPISDADVALRKALDLAGASMALPGFGVPDMEEDVPYDAEEQGL